MRKCPSCGEPSEVGQVHCIDCRRAGRDVMLACGKCRQEYSARMLATVMLRVPTGDGLRSWKKFSVKYCVQCLSAMYVSLLEKEKEQQGIVNAAIKRRGDKVKEEKRDAKKREKEERKEREEREKEERRKELE